MGELCRAWVNFNGTGTVAIRASFNVTSITDGGTGLYTVNFTNALTDANYAAVCNTNETGSDTSTRSGYATIYSYATGSAVIRCANSANGTAADQAYVSFSVFR
jgi:hypothetical protein